MKTKYKILMIALFSFISITISNVSKSQVSAGISFSVFHDNLQTYGRWVNNPTYGQIWICNEAGFRPYYTSGHWEYTDEGWMWVSDYPWGWAPFHYGRWAYDPAYGWFWVPGYDWAPAWVSWRNNDDYYGWTPLAPGLSINIAIGASIPAERWVFVPHTYITSPEINRYYVPQTSNVTIIKNTTVINNVQVTRVSNRNVSYVAGPRREDVERVTHSTIQTRTITSVSTPGAAVVRGNAVSIYRPQVDRASIEKNVHVTNNINAHKTVQHVNTVNHSTTAHVTSKKPVVPNRNAANQNMKQRTAKASPGKPVPHNNLQNRNQQANKSVTKNNGNPHDNNKPPVHSTVKVNKPATKPPVNPPHKDEVAKRTHSKPVQNR